MKLLLVLALTILSSVVYGQTIFQDKSADTDSTADSTLVIKPKKKSKTSFGVFGGVVVPAFEVSGESVFISSSTLKTKKAYTYGFDIIKSFLPSKRAAIGIGVTYEDVLMTGKHNFQGEDYTSTLTLSIIKVPLFLRYQFEWERFDVYCKAGAQGYFTLSTSDLESTKYSIDNSSFGERTFWPAETQIITAIVGAGVEWKVTPKVKIFLDASFHSGGEVINRGEFINITNQSFAFTTGLRF